MSAVELDLDCFYYDDGVVYDCADDQHQCEECQQVEAEPRYVEEGECAYQRHDDGNGGYYGGSCALQEEVDDKHHEDNGQCECLGYFFYGGIEVFFCA